MMGQIPKDPVILLSYINTRLRDCYPDLEALCEDMELDRRELESKLKGIDYTYDEGSNRFI